VGRTPAVQLAPGVWRISTAPADLVNGFAFVSDDGQVTLVDAGLKRAPRRIVAHGPEIRAGAGGSMTDKAGVR
jgi:hypothetical protein